MTALTAARTTGMEEMGAGETMLPMADNVKIWKGGMVAVNTSGLAVAAADTAGYKVVGIALDSVDNTVTGHTAGTWPASPQKNWIRVRFGVAALLNASGLTQTNLFSPVFVTDDNTVGLTSTNYVSAGWVIEFHSATAALIFIPNPNLASAGGLTADDFAIAGPTEIATVPVTHIAYSTGSIAGGSSTNISVAIATDSVAGATALFHLDLTDLLSRTSAGKGLTVNSITISWTLTATALTSGPTCAIVTQTFPAAAAAAGAPTASATAGGTITSVPATTQTAIPTAGQFYSTTFTLGTPLVLNAALMRAYAEIGFPCGIGSVVSVALAGVGYSYAAY